LVRNYLMCLVAWLSITFNFGLYPFCINLSKLSFYELKMLTSSKSAIGVAKIAFEL
jgi:hypothetical protein